jgi:membrane protein
MRALRVAWRLLRETVAEWSEDRVPRLGAALAYYAVFSLAPLLIIVVVIAGSVFGQATAQAQIVGQIEALLGPEGAGLVDRMIDSARLPRAQGIVTTAVGVVTLLIGALGAFVQLQDAFDTIWEVQPRQPELLNLLQYRLIAFGMVLVVGFLLLCFMVIHAVLASVGKLLEARVANYELLSAIVNGLLPLVVITVLFAIMFKILPNVRVAWRDVWPGAVLTAALFSLAKLAIGFYLGNSSLGSAYGAAGTVLVLLVWIYFSAQILFFGAEFTQVYVRHYGSVRPDPAVNVEPVTEAERSRQGIPHTDPRAARERDARPVPRQRVIPPYRPAARPARGPGYAGTLLGFAAGLGAGVMVALRTLRHSAPANRRRARKTGSVLTTDN